MNAGPEGPFGFGEAHLSKVEASIYEGRHGVAEFGLCLLTFESGEEMNVQPKVFVELETLKTVGADEDGRIQLQASGNGTLELRDANGEVLCEASWQVHEQDTLIALRSHLIDDLQICGAFHGEGKAVFTGKKISGSVTASHAGKDASGIPVLAIRGTGVVE
ncbi:MAG: hypothetical protein ACE5PT_14555 [Gemmatimonadales bacterium]